MTRKFLALAIAFAISLFGVQPGMSSMMVQSLNMAADEYAHTPTLGHADMAMANMDHDCCPEEHQKNSQQGDCDIQLLLDCVVHCALASPAFVNVAELDLWHPIAGADSSLMRATGIRSSDVFPPYRPPRTLTIG